MGNLRFKATENSIDNKDIEDLQKLFNICLPEDFVLHYKKYNGGWPDADRSEGEEFDYPFEYFLSIKYGSKTIEKKMEELRTTGVDLTNKIVFGVNDLDNTFHICTDKANYGNIYVYDDEWEYHCVSFSKFINGLTKSKFWGKIFDPKSQEWIVDENHKFYEL